MTGDIIKLAAQALPHLRLVDVYMRKADVRTSDAFDPRGFPPGTDFPSQFRHYVFGTEVLVPEDGEGEHFFRTVVEVAVRWGTIVEPSDQTSNSEDDSFTELGRIEATYVAEYNQSKEISSDALQAYSLKWPSVHIWPFWREFVANTCARLGVPKITIPVMTRAQNADVLCEVTKEEFSKVLYTKDVPSTSNGPVKAKTKTAPSRPKKGLARKQEKDG